MLARRRRAIGLALALASLAGLLITPVLTFSEWLAGGGGMPQMFWARAIEPLVTPLLTFGPASQVNNDWGRTLLPIYSLFLLGLLLLRGMTTDTVGRTGFRLARADLILNLIGNIADYWLGEQVLHQPLWGLGFGVGTMLGTLIYTVGLILFARVNRHAGTLPRWATTTLIAAPLAGILLAVWPMKNAPSSFVFGSSLGWLLIGIGLFTGHMGAVHSPRLATDSELSASG